MPCGIVARVVVKAFTSIGLHGAEVSRDRRTLMFATLMKLWEIEDGATAIEYGLIAALIAVAAISAFQLVGTNLSTTFHGIATQL
jgi:pilus assembly protein Flp/PilA